MPFSDVTLRDIYLARQRIAKVAKRTPLAHSPSLSTIAGSEVHMKLENLQVTGSFKLRGATNKLESLSDEERERGVITVSTGNHGRAVAHAAKALGVNAVICLPEKVARVKLDAIRALDPEVVLHGESYDDAVEHSFALQKEHGLTYVDPFDDPQVLAGQGTIGLEILEDLPGVDTVVVPLSGGGLLGGIALAMKYADPSVRTVGVSMVAAPVMYHSLQAGKVIVMDEEPTLADALVGGLGDHNQYTFRLLQEYVDDVVLVSEEEIGAAMAWAMNDAHLVVEGGGAVGLAALMAGKVENLGQRVAVVVSGSNVATAQLVEVVQKHGG